MTEQQPSPGQSETSVNYSALRESARRDQVGAEGRTEAEAYGRDEHEMAMNAALNKYKDATDIIARGNAAYRKGPDADPVKVAQIDAEHQQKRTAIASGLEPERYPGGYIQAEPQEAEAEYAAASEEADKEGARAIKEYEEAQRGEREGVNQSHAAQAQSRPTLRQRIARSLGRLQA